MAEKTDLFDIVKALFTDVEQRFTVVPATDTEGLHIESNGMKYPVYQDPSNAANVYTEICGKYVQLKFDKNDNSILVRKLSGKDFINGLTKETAKQNLFMINRRIAINYPLQAQVFNNNKVNAADVLRFWSDFLYTGGRVPSWVYTKGAAKAKEKKSKAYTNKDVTAYAEHYGISMKDLRTAMKFFPEETDNEIIEYKKFIEEINKLNYE